MYFCLVQAIDDPSIGIYVKKVIENSPAYKVNFLIKADNPFFRILDFPLEINF